MGAPIPRLTTESQDERLTRALEFSNYRITLANQRKNLQHKLAASLRFAFNGGIFHVDQTLIGFLHAIELKSAVLLDVNQNPIDVQDVMEFKRQAIEIYHRATNEFMKDYRELQKARTVKRLVDE